MRIGHQNLRLKQRRSFSQNLIRLQRLLTVVNMFSPQNYVVLLNHQGDRGPIKEIGKPVAVRLCDRRSVTALPRVELMTLQELVKSSWLSQLNGARLGSWPRRSHCLRKGI